ncbi:Oidioi.mRNA.OKI2018_I69.chr2.g7346.t1.cds [Oikopleura dioica]|uniref:Oidioi.mRNA.OKI2018_I69.chr2.g7346.t1.cds n=1 Tax=Oikopleura dioica TaxID=34765 RepID=A0ABN7T9K6_OIKDI|nr:Oidioi.mRNA.OKI2018_I69.chr2.g7346.t1.cds [Oikopleura dioica]
MFKFVDERKRRFLREGLSILYENFRQNERWNQSSVMSNATELFLTVTSATIADSDENQLSQAKCLLPKICLCEAADKECLVILGILMIAAALALAAVPVCVIFIRSKRVSKIKAAQKADLESIAESNRRDTLLNRSSTINYYATELETNTVKMDSANRTYSNLAPSVGKSSSTGSTDESGYTSDSLLATFELQTSFSNSN